MTLHSLHHVQPNRLSVTALLLAAAACFCIGSASAETDARPSNNQPDVTNHEDVTQLEISVGTSTVVNAPWAVSRVSITDPEIADVQVLTPTQVLLTAGALGSTDLILWSENEDIWHARVNVVVDLSYIRDELGKLFPTANLNIVQSRDMVIINGQVRRADEVPRLRAVLDAYGIKYLDATSLAGVQQVLLKVRVAEVSRQAIRQLSVNMLYQGDSTTLASRPAPSNGSPLFTFGIDALTLAPSTTLIGQFSGIDLQMFLQALSENQYVRILAEPALVAMSGEEASFLAGGEFPIPVIQGGGSSTGSSGITIEYKEFGVRLAFRPTVLGDNSIRLLVAPEVSDLSDVGSIEIEGFRIPSILTRRAQTTLELHSGQTFAMAGLLNRNSAARNSRIPLLGDLPIIGALFRSVRYQTGETELVVLVTATLVEPMNSNIATRPVPGDTYVEPSEWELYIDGRIEGKRKPLAPADAVWLREMGLNRLYGPGAWVAHDEPPPLSDSVKK